MLKRMTSLILALAMVITMLPVSAWAEETEPAETAVEETVAETTVPVEETTEPAETATEATEGITAPTETATEPEEETTAPSEEPTDPTEGVTAPTEEETVPEETVSNEAMLSGTEVASGTCGDNLTWVLDSEGTLTISGSGEMENYSDSSLVPWYSYRSSIKSVIIESGVTNIGSASLSGCINLETVVIPDSVTSIEYFAFGYCENLSTVKIPDSVWKIGTAAFYGCEGLLKVIIPCGIGWIGSNPFGSCSSLEGIWVEESNSSYSSDNRGVLFNKEKTVLIQAPGGLTGNYSIPNSVSQIEDQAFSRCNNLTGVTVPSGVNKIADLAFSYCDNLLEITIPYGVTDIEAYAFHNCTSLENVTIPDSVINIGRGAFEGCDSLEKVNVPSSVVEIGDDAFNWCDTLTGIWVDESNSYYSSDSRGVLFNKEKTNLIQAPGGLAEHYSIPESVASIDNNAFFYCQSLTGISIPDGISEIGDSTFYGCKSLREITIPDSITTISQNAFAFCWSLEYVVLGRNIANIAIYSFNGCFELDNIYFTGNAPSFENMAFLNVTATAYYPENNTTWTADIMQDYGGTLTWVPYTPGEEPGTEEETVCTLAELTIEDYLAFSAIVYKDLHPADKSNPKTVKQTLSEKKLWTQKWEKTDITYEQLCRNIASWKVVYIKNLSGSNGFYAAAFQNDNNEVVIAYRGSESLGKAFSDADAFYDWWTNDFPMILGNIMGSQFDDAVAFYDTVAAWGNISEIHTTGHSLGGAWGDIISAYSGCKAITFNAVPALDAAYREGIQIMSPLFTGVDQWNVVDHICENDYIAGIFEVVNHIKPYIAYKSNYSLNFLTNIGNNHSMKSIVHCNQDGDVELNEVQFSFTPNKTITNYMTMHGEYIDLGTSSRDEFSSGFLNAYIPRISYGGSGGDVITSSKSSDTIIGGKGNDTLDGSWKNDVYVYNVGDGTDTIYDVSGHDTLRIYGVDSSADIHFSLNDSDNYVYVYCNNELIAKVSSKNRANDSHPFDIKWGNSSVSITDYLSITKYSASITICCPVNVEVLDAEGNVVYTLMDGEVGNFYTDYGNFYVFEEEDGSYGKVLDLVEGYTARIVGVDTGTMKIDYREVVDGELAEPRNFVDVPVSAQFSATFEETEDGELVLAADTNGDGSVDAKIGYDGSVIACEEITVSEEYIVLQPGDEVPLHAEVLPGELTDLMVWSVEEGSEAVVSVDETGVVTALDVGTGYVLATVKTGDSEITARCRIDVAEAETVGEEEQIILDGVQLGTTKLTSELFSTDYAEFDVLLKLPQNMNFQSLDESVIPESNSVAIEDIYFTASTTKVAFDLVALDDRRVAVVPTEYAVEYPEELAKTYKSRVTIVVQGKEYTTEDELTLTLKQSKPKLKATIPAFNSFYDYQTQAIKVTGGTVTGITLNPDKTQPDWLTLNEDGTLSLNGNAAQKSGKVYLLVETEEWRIPAEITLTVKNARKTPGLKLSASSVKMAEDAASSSGVALKLLPKSKKDTISSLNVTGITSQTAGYSVTGFDSETGAFTLKAESGFKTGKVTLNVTFSNTSEVLPLTVKVSVQKVSLKLSARTVTLNKAIDDSAVVSITAAPADYILTAPTIEGNEAGLFDLSYENGKLTIHPTDAAEAGKTYKLSISAGGSKKVTLSVKVIDAEPTLTLKAKGNIDLSFPDRAATITATFKNYASGAIKDYTAVVTAPDGKTSEDFTISRDGTVFTVTTTNTDISTGSYKLTLKLALPNGTELENTVKLTVKRTAVKLKLAPAKLTLNKTINDGASVTVTCTTKGYAFAEPIWELKAKNGKDSAEGALDIAWSDGKLNIAVNDNTAYGATYKLLVKANAYAPVATLTITVPTEAKSAIKSSLKAKGTIDVIRAGTSITVTPSYKNCGDGTVGTEELFIYSSADKYAAPVTDLFNIEKDAQGRYILTAAEGLDHSKTYKAELVTTFGETKVTSARVALKVKMGSAKLTLTADSNILFANDKNSRVDFILTAKDASLNEIQEVSIKADRKGYDQMLEVIPYGNGEFAIGFKDETVDRSLIGKTITVTLNVKLAGNETAKVNTTAKLKLTIIK